MTAWGDSCSRSHVRTLSPALSNAWFPGIRMIVFLFARGYPNRSS